MSVARPARASRQATSTPVQPPAIQVRPGWLLGTLGLLLLAALCCAYASLCLLFYQGQWQLLYHPDERPASAPTLVRVGVDFSAIQFGPNSAGISELSGWWLPAKPDAAFSTTTVVYLHDGAESLSATLPKLSWLHALGCTVFAIDYRGYGVSASGHPSETRMVEDAGRALAYLTLTRHLPLDSIVLWGQGTGATIAAEAGAHQGPRLRLVLEDLNPPALLLLAADPRTRFLPLRLLLRDHLDAAPALRSSEAPKLFLAHAPGQVQVVTPVSTVRTAGIASDNSQMETTSRMYALAAAPKRFANPADDSDVRRFLAGGS